MIPIASPDLGKEELNLVLDAMKSGWISSQGPYIPRFEDQFAEYHETKFGVATSNGTTALHLALEALDVKKGDEVILPALTFVATANVVRYCNAKPVFVDINPNYWGIDSNSVEEKITPNTKVIIPVHLYGHPCDMDPLVDLAEDNSIYILEDAAEAHGAEYKSRKIGSIGDISAFSFYGNKIITTGEGGMCISNNEDLIEKMRIIRDHGMDPKKKYWHSRIGYNYRMTNIQAAIGVAQLQKLDQFIEKKRQIATWYTQNLIELANQEFISHQIEEKWAKSVFWMFSILINPKFGKTRDQIINFLKDGNIDSRPFFYPIPHMPPYASLRSSEGITHSESISEKGLNLPSSTNIKKESIEMICEKLQSYIE